MERTVPILVMLVIVGCGGEEGAMQEASMNFDLENVEPFLTRLNSNLGLQLPIHELVSFTQQTEVETEQSRIIQVTFDGQPLQLEYRVFMDDINAPDLYFLTPSKKLAGRINNEMVAFVNELGI